MTAFTKPAQVQTGQNSSTEKGILTQSPNQEAICILYLLGKGK